MMKKLAYSAGSLVLSALGYVAVDVWAQASKVPALEVRVEATAQHFDQRLNALERGLDQRLSRIEDSLDMLLRLQIRKHEVGGTIALCKDERGRVAACQEK